MYRLGYLLAILTLTIIARRAGKVSPRPDPLVPAIAVAPEAQTRSPGPLWTKAEDYFLASGQPDVDARRLSS